MSNKYKPTYPPLPCYIYRGKNAPIWHFSAISRTPTDFINSNIGAEQMTGQLYHEIIYQNCLQCSYLEYEEVLFCPCTDCPNWAIRFGITPDDFIILNGNSFAIVFNKSNFREGANIGPEISIAEMEAYFLDINKH
jgi:hypothetical protein